MYVRFSDTAEADLDEIKDTISQDDPRAALLVIDRLVTAAHQLGNFPFLGRPGRIEGTREFSVSRTSYVIVYTLPNETQVDIETFIHTRRNWPGRDA